MVDVCKEQTTPSYAQQRTAYAKSLGKKNMKEVVKERILENWTDYDCSNDATFDLTGLKKENITLSDVAAAMGDIFDEGTTLNFTYNDSTNLWGNGGLVDKLKDRNGADCDVREMDNIDLSGVIGANSCELEEAMEEEEQNIPVVNTLSTQEINNLLNDQDFRNVVVNDLLDNMQGDSNVPTESLTDYGWNLSQVKAFWVESWLKKHLPNSTYDFNDDSWSKLAKRLAGGSSWGNDPDRLDLNDFSDGFAMIEQERSEKALEVLMNNEDFANMVLEQVENGKFTKEKHIQSWIDNVIAGEAEYGERFANVLKPLRGLDTEILGDLLHDKIRKKSSSWGMQSSYITKADAQAFVSEFNN